MRDETLQIRKLWLGKLLKRSSDGIIYNDHEAGAIGPRLFEQACRMGLEGIVSKHRTGDIRPDHARIGSRSRTGSHRPCFEPRKALGSAKAENHPRGNAPDGRPRPVGLLL